MNELNSLPVLLNVRKYQHHFVNRRTCRDPLPFPQPTFPLIVAPICPQIQLERDSFCFSLYPKGRWITICTRRMRGRRSVCCGTQRSRRSCGGGTGKRDGVRSHNLSFFSGQFHPLSHPPGDSWRQKKKESPMKGLLPGQRGVLLTPHHHLITAPPSPSSERRHYEPLEGPKLWQGDLLPGPYGGRR